MPIKSSPPQRTCQLPLGLSTVFPSLLHSKQTQICFCPRRLLHVFCSLYEWNPTWFTLWWGWGVYCSSSSYKQSYLLTNSFPKVQESDWFFSFLSPAHVVSASVCPAAFHFQNQFMYVCCSKFLLLYFFFCVSVWCVSVMHVEVRRRTLRVDCFSFYHLCPGTQTQGVVLGNLSGHHVK